MDLTALENFLVVPIREKPGYAYCYELEPAKHFSTSSFVLIPYYSPAEESNPGFYFIKNKTEIFFGEQAHKTNEAIRLSSATSKKKYLETIYQLKQHIQRGDIYEINYCIRFAAEKTTIDPFNIFSRLNDLAKAPYAALLKTGDEFILCASPELFLKKDGLTLSTKPIKGTIRRGETPEEDTLLRETLYTSVKDRTENVMAVDVARNDLSQVAAKGSVTVNKLYTIESFETVHQMVSTVSCELRPNTSFESIIKATFPMASMTGAPKLRAMQLIDRYEDFKRGSYSGAMGLIDEHGNFSLSVIIRSIFYNQHSGNLSIAVGGAITYLSDPEQEYEECLLKAKALLTVLNATIV